METSAKVSVGYARLEAALATVFGFDPAGQRGKLRGRIAHLRRLGFFPEIGRGKVISYSYTDAVRVMLALTLEQAGIDPVAIVKLLAGGWDEPSKHLNKTAHEAPIASIPELILEAHKSEHANTDIVVTVQLDFLRGTDPVIGYARLGSWPGVFYHLRSDHNQHISAFNLSAKLRAFDAALAAPEKPKLRGLAKKIIEAGRKARGEE